MEQTDLELIVNYYVRLTLRVNLKYETLGSQGDYYQPADKREKQHPHSSVLGIVPEFNSMP